MKLTRLVHRVVPSWSAIACRVSLLGALAACGPTEEAPSAEARSLKTASAALTVPLQVSAETATNPQLPSGEATMASAVAAGNGIYLLVWMETAAGGSNPNIMGLRIRESDGALLLRCPATLTVECTYSGQRTLGNFEYGDNCGLNYVSTIPEYIGSPGTSTHYVYATDTSNNTTYCHTVWTVRDTRAPTVYLSGSANMLLTQGMPYQEPGYWGEDGCEGYGPWISSRIQVLGAVNSSQPGSYQLEYRLTDYSGNTGKAFRQVNVIAP
ncbi:DUF5011 domain-containing protein [Archangium gephyra]|nr:DUF5011 domain-containing protein [Archangium gephyra]